MGKLRENFEKSGIYTDGSAIDRGLKREEGKAMVVADLEKALDGIVMEQGQRHWRVITKVLGECGIPLDEVDKLDAYGGDLVHLVNADYITLSDLVVLGQYARAIRDGDTKAATFLRDTAGYKPATDVTIEHRDSGIESLSDEQLESLLDKLNAIEINGEGGSVDEAEQ